MSLVQLELKKGLCGRSGFKIQYEDVLRKYVCFVLCIFQQFYDLFVGVIDNM